jgi:AcrR family transcriptional regulator
MPSSLETKPSTRGERLRQASAARRERGKLELKRQILEAATALFESEGYESFSLRQVAEHIGYSPTAIYLHFQNKNDLLLTVAYEGFKTFGEYLQTAFDNSSAPLERLSALGRAYAHFAFERPLHYRLMFMQRGELLGAAAPEGYEHVIDSFGLLLRAVELAMDANLVQRGDPRAAAALLWSAVHGIVSLHLTGAVSGRSEAEHLVEWHLQVLHRGMAPL